MKRSTEAVLNDIEQVQQIANTDLEAVSWQTRGSWEVNVRQAKEQLDALTKEYRERILAGSVAIFVEGDAAKAAQFVEIGEAEANTITLDAGALYKKLAAVVEPALGTSREFTTHALSLLTVTIKNLKSDMGYREPVNARMHDIVHLRDHEELVQYIRTLVREADGDNMNRLFMENELVQKALQIRYMSNTVPVVVLNATSEEGANLVSAFGKGTFVVPVGEGDEVNSEFVIKAFKQVQKRLKK